MAINSNSKARRYFVVAGMLLSLAAAGCRASVPRSPETNTNIPNPTDPAEVQKRTDAYQQHVAEVLAPYWQSAASANPTQMKERILALTVPQEFLDMHLQLVVALTNLEQGAAKQDAKISASGAASLEELRRTYSWLGPVLQ